MRKWVISLWKFVTGEGFEDFSVFPGARVMTPKGPGTVQGGAIVVRLDVSPYANTNNPQLVNMKAWTFNLDQMKDFEHCSSLAPEETLPIMEPLSTVS